jgi:hypothetical protein
LDPYRRGSRGGELPRHSPHAGEGLLSLVTARLLAPRLTAENQQELLAQAMGKSKLAVEEVLVRHFPRPEVPSSVRRLPAVRPLTPERHEFRFTASAEARENLREAQELLRHAIPSGDPAQIIERALKLLVEKLRRKKYAVTDRPKARGGTAPGGRNIAAKVRRPVGARDEGRCTFVGKSGRRCSERAFVEFHHEEPYGIGGENTVANIHLLCRAHNAFESERFYGRVWPAKNPTLPGASCPPLG